MHFADGRTREMREYEGGRFAGTSEEVRGAVAAGLDRNGMVRGCYGRIIRPPSARGPCRLMLTLGNFGTKMCS